MNDKNREKRFPNESEEYRVQRNALLQKELELRAQIEAVAALRRELPLGGEIEQDYDFVRVSDGTTIKMSELFSQGKDTLLLYSYMFAPDADQPCSSCNSITDSFNGNAPHLTERVNFAVVTKAPATQMKTLSGKRNWGNLTILSSFSNTYNKDYFTETDKGQQLPPMNVFIRRDGHIYHSYSTEMLYAATEGDPRHADLFWPLWNMFDLTPEGRGTDWYPKLIDQEQKHD
jgi:predicted dithiol-disulfide oxidoreductase (DUF899 family)